MQQDSRKLAVYLGRRVPYLAIRKGVEVGSGLVVFSVLARLLSREDFAIYTLVLTLVSVVRVTSLPGLGNALTQSFARGRCGGFRKATWLSLVGSTVGGFLLLGAAWWHAGIGDESMTTALLAAGIGFPLYSGLLYWRNTAVGREQYGRLLLFDSASFLLRTAAIAACAFAFRGDLFPVILAALLAPAAVNLAATILQARDVSPNAEIEPGATRYGLQASLYELPALLAQRLDQIALFYLITPEALALYAVALRFPILIQAVMGEIIAVLGPVFARETGYTPLLRRFSLLVGLAFFGFCAVLALTVIPYLLPLVAGPKYEGAIIYAQILMVGAAAGTVGQIHFRFVKSQLRSGPLLEIVLARSAISVLIILTLTYLFGLEGVVAAFIINGLVSSTVTTLLARKRFSTSGKKIERGPQ